MSSDTRPRTTYEATVRNPNPEIGRELSWQPPTSPML